MLFSTVATKLGMPFHASVATAKSAVEGLTKSVAADLAPTIRVNAIAPSVTLSDRVKKLLESSPEIDAISKTHLLGLGEPIHVADLAVYLASNESPITTGQIISVDSGVTIV